MKRWHRTALVASTIATGIVAVAHVWYRRRPYQADWLPSILTVAEDPDIALAHMGQGRVSVVILAHGLLRSKNDRGIHSLAQDLSQHFDVITFDFAGHGQSAGTCDLDYRQRAHELSCVVDHAWNLGYRNVAVVGYGMGAAAAIIACSQGTRMNALVAVSTPIRRTRLLGILPSRPLQWAALALGTRLAPQLHNSVWPIERVEQVSPTPLLVVQSQLDALIGRSDSQALFAIARHPKELALAPMSVHGAASTGAPKISEWIAEKLAGQPGDQTRDHEAT